MWGRRVWSIVIDIAAALFFNNTTKVWDNYAAFLRRWNYFCFFMILLGFGRCFEPDKVLALIAAASFLFYKKI